MFPMGIAMAKTVKLFIGYPITSDIRMHLKQSSAWKQAKIAADLGTRDLQEVHFQDKEYIGKYLKTPEHSLQDLKTIESSIREALIHYCPELSQATLKIYLFPQIFIS